MASRSLCPEGIDARHGLEEHLAEERRGRDQDSGEARVGLRVVRERPIRLLRHEGLILRRGVKLGHVVVHGDVTRFIAIDEVHRALAHVVVDVVVEGPEQGHVEQELAARDVGVGDLGREVPECVEEVRPEALELGAGRVRSVLVHVVVLREPLGDLPVALFVDDERREDLLQGGMLDDPALLLEERFRETFDAGHVLEVLDDGDLFVALHRSRLRAPVQIVDLPLLGRALFQHALDVHGSFSDMGAW